MRITADAPHMADASPALIAHLLAVDVDAVKARTIQRCEGVNALCTAKIARSDNLGWQGLSLEIRPDQLIGSWWPAKFGDWVAKRDKLVGINARFDPPPRRAKTQARPSRRATRAFSCLMPLLRRRWKARFARRLGAGSVACPCAAASAPMSSRHCCSHCWSTSWAHPCLGAHAFAPCTRDPSALLVDLPM